MCTIAPIRSLAFVLSLATLAGCATTSTRPPEIDPELVRAEEEKQRALALEAHMRQQARLTDVAYRLARAAVPLCGEEVTRRPGFQFANRQSYFGDWRLAAAAALGLGDTLEIVRVAAGSPAARAGLRVGDRLRTLNGEAVPAGEGAAERLNHRFEGLRLSGETRFTIGVRRGAASRTAILELEETCRYRVEVLPSGELNAFADGDRMFVTSAMMRFATDAELSVVVAHELAHNAMRHLEARKSNAVVGAVLGALGDIALATAAVFTGGFYASRGAELGSYAYSRDFEREADYVGLYILAMAGMDDLLDEAPRFWRVIARADPESIELASTHPTTAERFVRMDLAVEEIRRKQRAGRPLRPEMKDEGEDGDG